MKLLNHFYQNSNIIDAAKALLGKYLCTFVDGKFTSGIITETEAYNGILDKASHAYKGRRTKRTEVMFREGGISYVYLCYGIHHLFNVIFSKEEDPLAVLVRSVQPVDGIETMMKRRGVEKLSPKISSGPGTAAQALGINMSFNGVRLVENKIWIEDRGLKLKPGDITSTIRIGVGYAGEDSLLPYRYYIKDNLYVSRISK